jgi:hypothetical protein
LVHHDNKLGADMIISLPQLFGFLRRKISAVFGEVQPYNGFACFPVGIAQFADKRLAVASFSPSLPNISAYGTRRPSDLIG